MKKQDTKKNSSNYWQNSESAGNNIVSGMETNKWYTFRISENYNNNTKHIVMETSASPISLSSVSEPSVDQPPDTDVTITITLSAAKSNEEKVMVRYSEDGWSTIKIKNASGSGTSYSANIQGSANKTVDYYALTTTRTVTDGNDLSDADLSTLAFNNDSGNNYSFATAPEPGMVMGLVLALITLRAKGLK